MADPPEAVGALTDSACRCLKLQNPDSLWLGSGRIGETKKGTISLKNEGASVLSLWLEPSCGCAYLQPRSAKLDPGERLAVEVGVALRHEDQQEHVRVRAYSDNSNELLLECMVTAECRRVLTVAPLTLDFGRIPTNTNAKLSLKVSDRDGRPFPASKELLLRSASSDVYVEPAPHGSAGEYLVLLRGRSQRGCVYGEVAIELPYEGYRRLVPISAEIVGAIEISPSSLYFPRTPAPGSGPRQATVFVWRGDKLPLGQLARHEAPPGVVLQESASPNQDAPAAVVTRRRLTVSLDSSFVLDEPISVSIAFGDEPQRGDFLLVPLNHQANGVYPERPETSVACANRCYPLKGGLRWLVEW